MVVLQDPVDLLAISTTVNKTRNIYNVRGDSLKREEGVRCIGY